MENLLREYLERSFVENEDEKLTGKGPVITISREFGCPSKLIAHQLSKELNRINGLKKPEKWRFINKEIIEETASQLGMSRPDVNFMLNSATKGLVEDVLASFSQAYISNLRMRKTMTSIVRTIARQGHVIIVGRGGAGILRDSPATLHIRLYAHRDWRIEKICKSLKISRPNASALVDEIDEKRIALIEMMTGDKFHPNLFDISFNCQSLNMDEIVHTVIALMQMKKLT